MELERILFYVLFVKHLKNKGVKDISTYDIRSKQYIPIRDLPKKKD